MPDLPKLTEAEIRQWTGQESFARGSRYYSNGAIRNPRVAGPTLKAQCAGSRAQLYRLWVTLGDREILAGDCSCPVGSGGHCKHAAALLLTWLHQPDEFARVEDMATTLAARSKAELIVLIGKMIERHPELEMLAELPAPGDKGSRPVDPENIRRQARHALTSSGYEWGAAAEAAAQLADVVDVGDGYAEAGDWRNAAVVYETTMREVLEEHSSFQDDEGDLGAIVGRCVQGLGGCLAATKDQAQRIVLLRALFDTYAWDIDAGGFGMGDEAPEMIVKYATPQERRQVAGWARAALPADESWSDDYRRKALGGFLLELEGEDIDDETWLRICRETGRLLDLVERLLTLRRVEEAREVASAAGDYDLFQMADILKAHGETQLATDLLRERAKSSRDNRLVEWLKQQAVERGDQDEALGWAQQMFWQSPSLAGYGQVKELAQAVGTWLPVQTQIIERLFEGKAHALLTEIYLKEGQIDRAIEAVKWVKSGLWARRYTELDMRVAAAAEETRPRESIRIYTDAAKALIQGRGRDNYVAAAEYLSRVRMLYQRLGEEAVWQSLIADIRKENSMLRALKEELNRLGL